jgi:uncharacterized protein YbaA (DUF1428 family)
MGRIGAAASTVEFTMSYIDGFVVPVPVAKREAYVEHARETAAMFKEYGATQVVECWGDDVPEGELTSFTMAVKRLPEEATVFSWILWPSRQVRDEAWKKIMEDPRMRPEARPMPFDGKRLIYGGFDVLMQV